MFEYDGLTVPRQEEGAHDVRQDLAFSTGSLLGRIAGIEDGAVLLDFGGGTVSLMPRDEDMEKLASAVNSLLRVSGARLDLTKVW